MTRIQIAVLLVSLFGATVGLGQQEQADKALKRVKNATRKLADSQKYELKYRFQRGEEVRWHVEHSATTKTQIAGNSETTAVAPLPPSFGKFPTSTSWETSLSYTASRVPVCGKRLVTKILFCMTVKKIKMFPPNSALPMR